VAIICLSVASSYHIFPSKNEVPCSGLPCPVPVPGPWQQLALEMLLHSSINLTVVGHGTNIGDALRFLLPISIIGRKCINYEKGRKGKEEIERKGKESQRCFIHAI
jgi:hypothetical protein